MPTVEDEIFEEIQQCVSKQRLKPYRKSQPSKKDAIALYLWNMALCEALYPVLQCIEVALRNRLHDALTEVKGTARWYEDGSLLWPEQQNRVAEAKAWLAGSNKPDDPCRVIAELTFGFWAGLLSAPYEQTVFVKVAPIVFARAPRQERGHKAMSSRVQHIRDLRNRVFHHEPIWKWVDLRDRHAAIVELLEWICPTKRHLIADRDRFSTVYDARWEAFREHVDWVFYEEEDRRTEYGQTTR